MNKLIWCLKQLLPLRYEATYGEDGCRYLEIWRMWFGRCFAQKRWRLHTDKSYCYSRQTDKLSQSLAFGRAIKVMQRFPGCTITSTR